MKLLEENITQTIDEIYLLETLNLDNKTILELGCGGAAMTKKIANNGQNRKIIACEVDEIQHKKNLKLNIKNIKFEDYPAEDIKLEDNSIDMVLMFKSFHHIPEENMTKALAEIKRVLKPNGLAYISEPLYQGEQNALISIFHEEKHEREVAFEHIKKAVDNEMFKLFKEVFFQTPITYENFDDFKTKQMDVTHLDNVYSKQLVQKVKEKYESYSKGKHTFLKPFRVDILQKV
ncbi:MAG: class I SAM-dependent methyltransferase [Halarcobacter sp.]